MFAFTEYLEKIEWTPRLLTELALTAITLLTVFINWLVRGWRIRGLNRRLARLESAANTISAEEAAEIRKLVDSHPVRRLEREMSALNERVTVMETSGIIARHEKLLFELTRRIDAIEAASEGDGKYGLKDELNRFKVVLLEEFGLNSLEQIERLIAAGRQPPVPPSEVPPEPLEAQFMRHFTNNDDLGMDDSDEITTLMREAYRAGGGQMTVEVVGMMEQMCAANWSAQDIEAAFTAKTYALTEGK